MLELTAEISVVYITSCDSQFRIGLTLAYNRMKHVGLLFISDEMHRFVEGLVNLLTSALVGTDHTHRSENSLSLFLQNEVALRLEKRVPAYSYVKISRMGCIKLLSPTCSSV